MSGGSPHPDSFGQGLASQGWDLLSGLRGVLSTRPRPLQQSRATRRCTCRILFSLWARHCNVCRGGGSVRPLCCRGVSGLHWGAPPACPGSLNGFASTRLPPSASRAASSLPCAVRALLRGGSLVTPSVSAGAAALRWAGRDSPHPADWLPCTMPSSGHPASGRSSPLACGPALSF